MTTEQALRFTWNAVPTELIRAILTRVYESAENVEEDLDLIPQMDDHNLRVNARRVFGERVGELDHSSVAPTLAEEWLPKAKAEALFEIAEIAKLSAPHDTDGVVIKTKSDALEVVSRLAHLTTVQGAIVGEFHNSHRAMVDVVRVPVWHRSRQNGLVELAGADAPEYRLPFPHQRKAWAKLDDYASRGPSDSGALLVLPTGAGKTFTMVSWLLRQLNADPDLRVLWLADQIELVDQAARAFAEHARHQPRGFQRTMRVMHSAAGAPSGIGDADAAVLAMTRQSLLSKSRGAMKKSLEAILKRPTIVVIDEAHHAVAPGYRTMLRMLWELQPETPVIGLTATPYPMGQGKVWLLNSLFPTRVADVKVLDMIADGVLARPVFHTVHTKEFVKVDEDVT